MVDELSARQRKHVHMHSTIFSADGPAPQSVYKASRQQELYRDVQGALRENNRSAPEIALPSAADIKCTQNAGHSAVLPSRGAEQPPRRPATAGSPQVLVYDGEAHDVKRASARDTEAIPKEFWSTSVNLQWHDTRNEQVRQRGAGAERAGLSAQDSKRHELSSAIFGQARVTNASTRNARSELLADTADHLQMDSTLCGRRGEEVPDAHRRFQANLTNSAQSTLARDEPLQAPPRVENEDPEGRGRRRAEKNFSDIFGAKMGERREIRGREEILCANNCSFLDSRGEIAARNKEHWRLQESGASDRKQAERNSKLFDFNCPERPTTANEEAVRDERACWDSRDIIEASSEIARRQRLKDHMKDFNDDGLSTHLSRKQEMMSSDQVKRNMQPPPDVATPASPARQSAGFSEYAGSPRLLGAGNRAGPGTMHEREQLMKSARDIKLASMQSNIF